MTLSLRTVFVSLTLLSSACEARAEYKTFVLSCANSNYPAMTNFFVGPNVMVEFLGSSKDEMDPEGGSTTIRATVILPDAPGTTNFVKATQFDGSLDWALAFRVFDSSRVSAWPTTVVGQVLLEFRIKRDLFSDGIPLITGSYTITRTSQTGAFTPSTAVVIPAGMSPIYCTHERSA